MLQFTLFGFPIRIQWMFWLVGCLLALNLITSSDPQDLQCLVIWLAVFSVSILWHELGHAFAMRKYGGRPEILLYGMGGLCSSVGRYTRKQSMIISAAGPAAGFLLALIAFSLMQIPSVLDSFFVRFALRKLLFINVVWTILNLLPILPLDGGQILRSFMSNTNPAIAPKIGMVTAGTVALLSFFNPDGLFMAIMFGYLAYQNWNMSKGQSFNSPF